MSRILSYVLLATLALPAMQIVSAQEKGRAPTAGSSSYTLKLRRPAWFGFAVDCGDCAQSAAADTVRRPLVITRVAPGSPANRGALQVGDTILTANGKSVSSRELQALLESATPGGQLQFVVGTSRGRFSYRIRPSDAPVITIGKDTLPIRYRGEYAEVTIDVLSNSPPVVTRDSSGAVLIRMGEHVIRLQRTR